MGARIAVRFRPAFSGYRLHRDDRQPPYATRRKRPEPVVIYYYGEPDGTAPDYSLLGNAGYFSIQFISNKADTPLGNRYCYHGTGRRYSGRVFSTDHPEIPPRAG